MPLTKVTYSMIQDPTVNVLDYGATGDGTTNDAAAIASAIATGKNVYFPRGEYFYNSNTPVQLNSNQTIYGSGQGASVIKSGSDASGSYGVFYASSKSYVCVHSLTLDGNSTVSGVAAGGDRSLLRFSSCSDVTIYDIEIKGYGQKESGTIPLANPENYSWAVGLGGCNRLSIEDIYLHDCYVEGFAVYNCKQVECNNFRGYLGTGNCSTPLHIAAFGDVNLCQHINVSNVFIDGSAGSAFNFTGEYLNANNITILNPGSAGIDSGEEGLTAGQFCAFLNYSNISIVGSSDPNKSTIGIICTGENINVSNVRVAGCQRNFSFGSSGLLTKNYALTNCSSTNSVDKAAAGVDYNIFVSKASNITMDGCVFDTTQAGANMRLQNCSNLKINKCRFATGVGGNISQTATTFGWITSCAFDQSAITSYASSQIQSTDGALPVGTTANIWLESNYFVGSTNTYAVDLTKGQNVFTHNNINDNVNAGKRLVYMDVLTTSDVVTDDAAVHTYRIPLNFGNAFVWVGSDGKLYINTSRPTSDTDGTVVGTQT